MLHDTLQQLQNRLALFESDLRDTQNITVITRWPNLADPILQAQLSEKISILKSEIAAHSA